MLEIGCGTGENLLYFANLGDDWDCYCIDLSGVALSMLSNKKNGGNKIHAFRGNFPFDTLPSGWDDFDVILMRSVMYHQTNQIKRAAMRKMFTLLKDKGVVVDKEYDPVRNQAVQDQYNMEHGETTARLGPLHTIKTEELIDMYVEERYAKLDVRSSNCEAMKVSQHFVYCMLMVFRKV